MLCSVFGRALSLRPSPAAFSSVNLRAAFSTSTGSQQPLFDDAAEEESGRGVAPEDRPYLHHGQRPRFRDYEKFRSPRRRASKLLHEITQETITKLKAAKPAVWETDFRVGDAVELQVVTQGGAKSDTTDKMRGVVLGIFNKGIDKSILIRDVVFGEPIERRIPLHSPLVKSLKVLAKNFVFKGRKRIKRAKLYYLSDWNPLRKLSIACFEKSEHLVYYLLTMIVSYLLALISDSGDWKQVEELVIILVGSEHIYRKCSIVVMAA